jgi:hypothetical protein
MRGLAQQTYEGNWGTIGSLAISSSAGAVLTTWWAVTSLALWALWSTEALGLGGGLLERLGNDLSRQVQVCADKTTMHGIFGACKYKMRTKVMNVTQDTLINRSVQ